MSLKGCLVRVCRYPSLEKGISLTRVVGQSQPTCGPDRHCLISSLIIAALAGCAVHRAPSAGVGSEDLCGRSIAGSHDLIENQRLILLGEVYGTKEMPSFAASIACQGALSGRQFAIAVELPQKDQVGLRRYLVSNGTEQDKRKLLQLGSAWHDRYYDGRSSEAILNLIEQIRLMRQMGLAVSIFAIDNPNAAGAEREAAMARAIADLRASRPQESLIVLTGYEHARLARGGTQDPALLPVGWHLQSFGFHPVSLSPRYIDGAAWNCQDLGGVECKEHPLASNAKSWLAPVLSLQDRKIAYLFAGATSVSAGPPEIEYRRPYVKIWGAYSEGYSGEYFVGQPTASPPAWLVHVAQEPQN